MASILNNKNTQIMLAILLAMGMMSHASAQTCSTGSGCPTKGDANTCVQYLRSLGSSQCCQQASPSGSCTNMCASGTAAVDICGTYNTCTTCVNAGDLLNTVLANCPANVNGQALVCGSISGSNGLSFKIRHS